MFNSTAIPSSARETNEALRTRPVASVTRPEVTILSLAGGEEAIAEARQAIRAHLRRYSGWSLNDAANIACYLVKPFRDDPPATPILDVVLHFNADAQALGMPPLSYSAFVAGLAQLARVTDLVVLDTSLATVRITPRTAPPDLPAQRRTKGVVTRQRLEELSAREELDATDDLAVVVAFAARMLHHMPHLMTQAWCVHRAYLVWATLMDIAPMSYLSFRVQMKAFIGAIGLETVSVVTDDGDDTYKGLSTL